MHTRSQIITIPDETIPLDGTVSLSLECQRAKQQSGTLIITFEQVVRGIKQKLTLTISVADFRSKFLFRLSNYSPRLKSEHCRYFQKNLKNLIKQKTYNGLFDFLNFYWDFLNYNLLEHIVRHFGSSDIKRKMGQYCLDIKRFRKSTTLRVFRELQQDEADLDLSAPEGFQLVKTVHNITLDSTLEDVNKIRLSVARDYQLQEFALYIAIGFGSVFITWLVPQSIINDLAFGLTTQLLDELHIVSFTLCSQGKHRTDGMLVHILTVLLLVFR